MDIDINESNVFIIGLFGVNTVHFHVSLVGWKDVSQIKRCVDGINVI